MGLIFERQSSRLVIPNRNDELYQMVATRASVEGLEREQISLNSLKNKQRSGGCWGGRSLIHPPPPFQAARDSSRGPPAGQRSPLMGVWKFTLCKIVA